MRQKDLLTILKKLDIGVVHINHRGWAVAPCPFAEHLHEKGTDATPSFNVKINPTGFSGYKCHSCHQTGNVSNLATRLGYYRDEDLNHIALQAAILEVPDSFPDFEDFEENYEASVTPIANAQIYLTMYPDAGEDPISRSYLVSRGIHRETAELIQLKYDPEGRRILFPVFDYKNDLFGLTGRSIIPDGERTKDIVKVKNYAGLRKDLRLLGEQLINPDLPLFTVEGLFAFAHLIEIGAREVCNPIATMGSDMSFAQRDLIVSHDLPVYLCYDDDEAGSIGLYGPWNKKDKKFEGNGAIDRLRDHAPTMVCAYPERTNEIDEITLDELKRMIEVDHDMV